MRFAILLVSTSLLFAQPPSFEVASVKLHEGPNSRPGVHTSGNRLDARARTVAALIMYAYNVRSDQLADSPALGPFGGSFYDVTANAPGDQPPSVAEFRLMMQSLLADRFKLALHREMRELPVYEMVVAKNGPKLKPAAPGADPKPVYHESGRNWETTVATIGMPDLAALIENIGFVGRHVIDKTGLTGNYEVKLTFTPDTPPNLRSPEPTDQRIFDALPEQLGLRLQPQRALTEVLVVDHVEKPSAN